MLAKANIISDKVVLRNIEIKDCNNEYLSWLMDESVNRFLETRWYAQSLDKIIDFVRSVRESNHSILFAIIDLKESQGKHIGNIKIGPVDNNNKCADVSYFIGDKQYWNKGYATEAVKLVIQYGFNVLNLHRISAGVIDGNISSSIVLQKAGMTEEGTAVEASFDGKFYRNVYKFSIINNN